MAELTFGFWWSLTADNYDRRLWAPCLRFAFDGPVRRRRLHSVLDELRRLRNRIAHHEPIHSRRLDLEIHRLLDTAARISPVLHDQIRATTRIPSVLVVKPSPPPNGKPPN